MHDVLAGIVFRIFFFGLMGFIFFSPFFGLLGEPCTLCISAIISGKLELVVVVLVSNLFQIINSRLH